MEEKVIVYVDIPTFYGLVLKGRDFDAMLWADQHAKIAVTVNYRQIQSTNDQDMVTIRRR